MHLNSEIKKKAWKLLEFPRFMLPKKFSRFADPELFYIDKLLNQIKFTKNRQMAALDAGAGNQNKKPYLTDKGYLYESCDFENIFDDSSKLALTHVCTLDSLPMKNNTYDLVICVQVLEHLSRPEKSISEMHRVLKPGGLIFLSTNFLYPRHGSPYDYFRFTEFGLKYIFDKCGFQLVLIESHGGFPAMCAQFFHELPFYLRNYVIFGKSDPSKTQKPRINRLPLLVLFIIPIFVLNITTQFLAFFCHAFDKLDRNKRYTLGYSIIAAKQIIST